MRSKRQSLHIESTQSQTVFGILSYTSVLTTGPTSRRSLMALNDAWGVKRSAATEQQGKGAQPKKQLVV